MIETVVPKFIELVSVEQIIAFRDDYKKERVRFYEALEGLVKDAPNISDPEYLEDYIKEKATIVENKVDALKHSLNEVKIETANKLLAIATAPMALQMTSILPQAAPIIITAGLFLAGYGLIKQGRQNYMIKKENCCSYVLSLERGIKPKGLLQKMLNV